MKQGGESWNTSPSSKRGIINNYKCKYCQRRYKQYWTCKSHENGCKEYNHK